MRMKRMALLIACWAAGTLVTSGADWYVATNGAPGDGHSWAAAYTNLQTALDAATNNDTIYVAGHTFGVSVDLSWTGRASSVTILGGYAVDGGAPGARDTRVWPTVLRRSGAGRLFSIQSVTNGTLDGVTLTGGNSVIGAGLYVNNSPNLLVADCVISNNIAGSGQYGGGLHLTGSLSSCIVSNCLMSANQGTGNGAGGGAFYVDSGTSLLCVNSVVRGNTTISYGAAIMTYGTTRFRNCLVVGNGGTSVDAAFSLYGGSLTLENCTVANNARGGFHKHAAGTTLAITNCIVWDNGDDFESYPPTSLVFSDIEDGDSNGVNGNISASPGFEFGYYLATNSPCVDSGTNSAAFWGLDSRTTRADGSNDSGTAVDMGYHYAAGLNAAYAYLYVATNGDDVANTGTNAASPFRTIGKALATAQGGTQIQIGAGQYTNGLETFPLTLADKSGVGLLGAGRDATVLNASGASTGVLEFTRASLAIVRGLTITGGNRYDGGGVWASAAGGLVLADCVIRSNRCSNYGGGVWVDGGSCTISNSLVSTNYAGSGGGAFHVDGGGELICVNSIVNSNSAASYGSACMIEGLNTTRFRNCLIVGNGGASVDAAFSEYGGSLTLENCTVANNARCGFHKHAAGTTLALTNCIVRDNGDDFDVTNSPAYFPPTSLAFCNLKIAYSFWTNGINGCNQLDPLFVDTNYYHLQSKQGCYTNGYFSGGGWTAWNPSGTNSPLIDAGPPASDYASEPVPNGGRVNMGAYGNTAVASLTDTQTVHVAATVTNLGATVVGHSTARLNGQVTDIGTQVPACGFAYWILGSGPTTTVSAGSSSGVFFSDVTGLTLGSDYQFNAYATNVGGQTWSGVKSFHTFPAAVGFYVATNGDNTAGTNWSTAYTDPQSALSLSEAGDTIYVAGHTFGVSVDLSWMGRASSVTVKGGYAATNAAETPGLRDTLRWPTVLRRSGFGRLFSIQSVTNGTLDGVTLTGGNGVIGAGLYVNNSPNLLVADCVISNNICATTLYGGGLHLTGSLSSCIVSNCLMSANQGTGNGAGGGAFYVDSGTSLLCVNSVVRGNTIISAGWSYGSAIMTYGTTRFRNCLIVGNGGASVDAAFSLYGGSLTLENCTVANNARCGFHKHAAGTTLAITNCIVWDNGDDFESYPPTSLVFSDIEDGDSNGVNGNISADPLFVNAALGDYHLTNSSPCLNTGTNQAWMVGAWDLDGSGHKRIRYRMVDMGAYEALPPKATMFGIH